MCTSTRSSNGSRARKKSACVRRKANWPSRRLCLRPPRSPQPPSRGGLRPPSGWAVPNLIDSHHGLGFVPQGGAGGIARIEHMATGIDDQAYPIRRAVTGELIELHLRAEIGCDEV